MPPSDDVEGTPPAKSSGAPANKPTRLEREAEALRANLRRRKQQAQARAAAEPAAAADDTDP